MNSARNKMMIMAGGTGGHVFPALAVALALRSGGTEIVWLGTQKGLEARVVPEHNIPMRWLSIAGLRGKGLLSWLLAPLKLSQAVWQSLRALRETQPDCVLGMGGFAAGPGGIAARLTNTPLIIHEQNAVAGLTNFYLAKIAQRVITGFPNVSGLPKRAVWLGNPVREEIKAHETSTDDTDPLRVLVIGGSQGAHSLNRHLPTILAELPFAVDVWHQSGRGRNVQVEEAYASVDTAAKVSEFIEDMPQAYAWAEVLICRAGAMTIAECCAAAKAAILVPYPHSAGDHQRLNAQMMVDAQAAWMVDNDELSHAESVQKFVDYLGDRARLRAMSAAASTLHKPNALNDVVAVCQEYLHA